MTEGSIARIAPLVEELDAICRGHEEGHGGPAAARMLASVRTLWPEIPDQDLSQDPDHERDPEVLALRIVREVGETAGRLLDLGPEAALGWSRPNLAIELERYLAVVGGR